MCSKSWKHTYIQGIYPQTKEIYQAVKQLSYVLKRRASNNWIPVAVLPNYTSVGEYVGFLCLPFDELTSKGFLQGFLLLNTKAATAVRICFLSALDYFKYLKNRFGWSFNKLFIERY